MIVKWLVILLSLFTPTLQENICSVSNPVYANTLDIEGDDVATNLTLPFEFPFYCQSYTDIGVSTNGLITFDGPNPIFTNVPINSSSIPNNYITPFWADLITLGKTIYYKGNSSQMIIQWTNMEFYGTNIPLGTFQTTLYENGTIQFNYLKLLGSLESLGSTATIGIKKNSTTGLEISFQSPNLYTLLEYSIFPVSCDTYDYTTHVSLQNYIELITNNIPAVPELLFPLHNQEIPNPVTLSWNVPNATYYKLYISESEVFAFFTYSNNNYLLNTYTQTFDIFITYY